MHVPVRREDRRLIVFGRLIRAQLLCKLDYTWTINLMWVPLLTAITGVAGALMGVLTLLEKK